MKKIYVKPEMAQEIVNVEHTILAGSGEGVETGNNVGNDFNADDMTYGNSGGSLWDDED